MMAERRMFAKSVIMSARFLRMPATSRLLYYDLGLSADDDGVVEAFTVMRTTGATEDDLRVLASKGFVRVLNEDFVTYITDWSRNNYIQKDRYHPSIYAALLVQIEDGSQLDTPCIHDVSNLDTEVRDSLGESQASVSLGDVFAEPEAVSAPPVISLPLNTGEEYSVTAEQFSEWKSLYPAVDIMQQLRNMRGWLLSNPDRRKTKRGISRFVTGWLAREQDRGRRAKPDIRRPNDYYAETEGSL